MPERGASTRLRAVRNSLRSFCRHSARSAPNPLSQGYFTKLTIAGNNWRLGADCPYNPVFRLRPGTEPDVRGVSPPQPPLLLALPKRSKRLVFFISIGCLAACVYVAGLSYLILRYSRIKKGAHTCNTRAHLIKKSELHN